VGALAHYLEERGIPTTQVSLIAEHTEIIRPPRALWVPFQLGRPLGAPDYPEFQRKVALAALNLLEAEQGPVLESFPEEAPDAVQEDEDQSEAWSCPVSFAPPSGERSETEELAASLHREVAELRPWYDLGLERSGRTAMVSFDPEPAANLLEKFLTEEEPPSPGGEQTPAVALRLAAQDLKAFYFEAAISRPGAKTPDSRAFSNWFWKETAAGKALEAIRDKFKDSGDKDLSLTARMFLVPMPQ
jgi:hypothetical protein